MHPRVIFVEPLDNFTLKLKFTDDSTRIFDMKPYLSYPVFRPLKEKRLFNSAGVFPGSVKWNEDIDMSPDTLFLESEIIV